MKLYLEAARGLFSREAGQVRLFVPTRSGGPLDDDDIVRIAAKAANRAGIRKQVSAETASAIVRNPASQKLIDNAHQENINVIQEINGKSIRITVDPRGQRIISAGIVRANSIKNGIANGRFIPQD